MDQVNENTVHAQPLKPTMKQIGREAVAVTHKSGAWHHLTVALLVAMLFTYAISVFFEVLLVFATSAVTNLITWYIFKCVFSALAVLACMLFAMPVWFARLRMAALLSGGRETSYRDIFYYFENKRRLFRAWRVAMLACVAALAVVLMVVTVFWGAIAFHKNMFANQFRLWFEITLLVPCLMAALGVTLLILLFAGAFLPFVATALGNEEMSVRRAFAISLRAAKGNIFYIFCFTLNQIPHVLLSILTIGVYYIFWYAPRFVLSYLRLSQVLCTNYPVLKEDLS